MIRKSLLLLVFLLHACALHLRAPEPDIRTLEPVLPAGEPSSIAAVARFPLQQIATLVENFALAPVQQAGSAGPVQWTVQVARAGIVTPRAENGSLCLLVPFRVLAKANLFGTALDRTVNAAVDVCARPVLEADAQLRLQNPVVRVRLEQLDLPGPLRMLSDVALESLQQRFSRQLGDIVGRLKIPLTDAVTPLLARLNRPFVLPNQSCVKLRPQQLRTTQPEVDPGALRLAVAIVALPTVEQPCVDVPLDLRQVPIVVETELTQPETRLLLPIGVGLETLRLEAQKQLVTGKPLQLDAQNPDAGWVQVDAIALDSAKGMLLIRAKLHGQVRDKILFWPIQRDLDGEFLIWGKPEVTETEIRLTDLHLDMTTDDRLVELGVALKRADIVRKIADHVRMPRGQVEAQARAAVLALAVPLNVGGQTLPVRIDVKQLTLESVRAAGQRLEVAVRFIGYIVLGGTDRN